MPLDEEGAKWSCEPCIRGHRSSKCQHFDRLMIKVPKAGRPLAKCPHPKGTCSCQKLYAFMIRIPKGSGCICRPVYKLPVDGDETDSPTLPTPPATTMVPAVPSPIPGGKVQKSGRRQSVLQAAPENIAKALGSLPQFGNSPAMNGTLNNLASYSPHTPGFNNAYSPWNPEVSGYMAHQSFKTSENPTPQGSSCCSKKPEPPKPVKTEGSCCGKSKSPEKHMANGETGPKENKDHYPSNLNQMAYPQYSAPQAPAPQVPSWQGFNGTGQGHYMQPFVMHQPQAQPPAYLPGYVSNRYPTTSMGYPYENISQNLSFAQPAMPSFPESSPHNFTYTPPPTFDGDRAHECSCGDGCQCLGCASHPFNNTTRQHVQEMGRLVTINDGKHSPEGLNGHQTPLLSNNTNESSLDFSFPNLGHGLNDRIQQTAMNQYTEQTSYPGNHPSGYSSPTDFTQLMEPSEYYTLEYPVGLANACSDVSGSCQCGNDCCCIGCLTHSGHNGVPLEAPVTTAEDTSHQETTDNPWSSSLNAEVDSSHIPVLDELPAPSLSPQTIDP